MNESGQVVVGNGQAAPRAGARQAAVTVASGRHAERLDETFTSFAASVGLEMHAVVLGERLPDRQVPGVRYHLEAPDSGFGDPMRDLYYRRLLFLDGLGVDYAVLVDNSDVLCMQPLPEIPALLRGAVLGACVEHGGSRYLEGQGYTSCYFNAGVTFWDVRASRGLREEVVARGRQRYRGIEDQLTLNEVVHTRYCDRIVILPSQYNFRACLAPFRLRGWPTVAHLDGVRIYHNTHCVAAAKRLLPVRPMAELKPLPMDTGPLTRWERFRRRFEVRFGRHWVR
jgi:hypothetical protein